MFVLPSPARSKLCVSVNRLGWGGEGEGPGLGVHSLLIKKGSFIQLPVTKSSDRLSLVGRIIDLVKNYFVSRFLAWQRCDLKSNTDTNCFNIICKIAASLSHSLDNISTVSLWCLLNWAPNVSTVDMDNMATDMLIPGYLHCHLWLFAGSPAIVLQHQILWCERVKSATF